ncbi:TlpA family protein disulfide reductase [Tenacibaculum sp. SDUM215027]|uniref:TlpA family protein disulfide reductase n=1 Tax=Tenacibaculum sp. SDUM215027 TaxID=3422596 RepID=UPI003D31FB3A
MQKALIILFIFFQVFISCKNPEPNITESFEFAVYDNEPIFVDEYLYQYENKNGIKLRANQTEWYLIDWNGNGIYNEIGIDYYGVKSPFKRRPILSLLEQTSTLNHNEITYSIENKTGFKELNKTVFEPQNDISYISDFIPIELSDGNTVNSDIFKDYDKTVIYYWATWCAPCVEKLEQVESNRKKLKLQKVNFVPIYYGCSYGDVIKLNEKKGLNFNPIEVSNRSAISYQLAGLPETYVFDSNGKLIAEHFDVE